MILVCTTVLKLNNWYCIAQWLMSDVPVTRRSFQMHACFLLAYMLAYIKCYVLIKIIAVISISNCGKSTYIS